MKNQKKLNLNQKKKKPEKPLNIIDKIRLERLTKLKEEKEKEVNNNQEEEIKQDFDKININNNIRKIKGF